MSKSYFSYVERDGDGRIYLDISDDMMVCLLRAGTVIIRCEKNSIRQRWFD